MRKIVFIAIIILVAQDIFAWTSSNAGMTYTIKMIFMESEDVNYIEATSQYVLETDIEILENDTLLLQPGDKLKFINYGSIPEYGIYGIKIYGTLLAIGTDENPVILGDPEYDLENGNSWTGIRFYDTSNDGESKLKHCYLRGANSVQKEASIYLENSSPIIDNCRISTISSLKETGGGAGVRCKDESFPLISNCTFDTLRRSIAIYSNAYQDTNNTRMLLINNCNFLESVQGYYFPGGIFYDKIIIGGGFLDNCYLELENNEVDMSLGEPIDTIGDGLCTTTSTNWLPRFYKVDGVKNPRSTSEMTNINSFENEILPTSTNHLLLNNSFPNPSHDIVNIKFNILKNNLKISLIILDSGGNKIVTLIDNESYNIGTYSTIWDGKNYNNQFVESGIYFYKLQSNKTMMVKKAIIVK